MNTLAMYKTAHALLPFLLALLCSACCLLEQDKVEVPPEGTYVDTAFDESELGPTTISVRPKARTSVTIGPQFATHNASAGFVQLTADINVWPTDAPVKLSFGKSVTDAIELNSAGTNHVKFELTLDSAGAPAAMSLVAINGLVADKTWDMPVPSGPVDPSTSEATLVLTTVPGVDVDKWATEATFSAYGIPFTFYISEV